MDRTFRHNILIIYLVWGILSGQQICAGFQAGKSPEEEQDSIPVTGLRSRLLYSLLNLQFREADSLLDHSGGLLRDSPFPLYLKGYLEFLEVLIEGDPGRLEKCLEDNGQRLEDLKDLADGQPESYAFLSTLHLQSFLLSASLDQKFRAAKHFYYAYHYLKQSEEKHAGDPLNYRNRGLITLIAASVPEEFAWMFRVLGIPGDLAEGMGYLNEYQSSADGAERLEAVLLQRLSGYTFRTEDLPVPGNADPGEGEAATLGRFVAALETLGTGRSDAVVGLLGNYKQAGGEKTFPYLDLLLGEAMLNGLDTAALIPLQHFAGHYRGSPYRQYVWHKIAWCYALRGEWDRYRDAGREVLNCGKPYLDADRQALSETLDTLPLNLDLLKARLLFDGGYYRRALNALGVRDSTGNHDKAIPSGPGGLHRAIPLKNSRDSLEYAYRLGRIYDRMGNRDSAVLYYERVLSSGPGQDWYFAPNSALHLGLIREKSGDPETALEYYRKCIRINRSAYKKSIDYKARQGIRRMEDLQKLR